MAYMAPYIDETGMHIASYTDLRDALIARMQDIFGADIYLDNDSQDYQLISAFALMLYDVQQGILLAYNNASPTYAVGAALDRLVVLNGIRRIASSQSTCTVTLTGTPGTKITGGVVQDERGYYWDLPAEVFIGDDGSASATVTCRTSGNITAAPGDLHIISTPTRGWIAVTNETAAVAGTAQETDVALRARQKVSTANPSNTVFSGTIGAVSNLDGVTRWRAYENDTGETVDGLPPHSITMVVEGGEDAEIAQAIFLHKTPGCYTNGDVAVQVTEDRYGASNTIRFFRPTYVDLSEVRIDISPLEGYSPAVDQEIRKTVYEYINGRAIGEALHKSNLYAPIMAALGTPPKFYVAEIEVYVGASRVSGTLEVGKTGVLRVAMADIYVGVTTG